MAVVRKLTILLVCFACTFPAWAKTYVLCVGIADYPGTRNDLAACVSDVLAVKDVFQKSNANAYSITNKQATVKNVCKYMRIVFGKAKANDVVVLYFSGHGTKGALCCYDDLLYYQTIFNVMKQCKAQNKIVLADACFTGKMRNDKPRTGRNYSNLNLMLFLSSRDTETSWEGINRHGFFTYYLLEGLKGYADTNRDRTITAKELYDYVHPKVVAKARKIGKKQHPVAWGNFSKNMPVIKW